MMNALKREFRFLLRQRAVIGILLGAFALSSIAVWAGVSEVSKQNAEITALLEADAAERVAAIEGQSNYGGAAYYTFHLTYDRPSSLAFAALGVRDIFPWKHRIRMLALEGQIYETDGGNPALSNSGRFDYVFVAALIAPLLVILLLHDLCASERAAGRYDLLVATEGGNEAVWVTRTCVRALALTVAVTTPFLLGALVTQAPASAIAAVFGVTALHIAFWALLAYLVTSFKFSAPTTATLLAGFWVATSFVAPSLSDSAIEQAVPSPEGGDIVLQQREAVNDAWDVPKDVTMRAFLEQYPQWTEKAAIEKPFEWKWYYAFQQVGDMSVAEMAKAYRTAIEKRYALAGVAALASPPALVTRALTRLADTDVTAALNYEKRVRAFHEDLRMFHYPLLFEDPPYSAGILENLPAYSEGPSKAQS
ncbi:MAG: DUF3526 domain-containing protein [Pseudomonadota bacterium]